MTTITDFMQNHHKECDELLVNAETAASQEDWPSAEQSWSGFSQELNSHIGDKEEGILFPAIENKIGPMGPTQVMRGEHEQIRALVAQIDQTIASKDKPQTLGLIDTLMILIQQHNMKEEQILYPMMDGALQNIETLLHSLSE